MHPEYSLGIYKEALIVTKPSKDIDLTRFEQDLIKKCMLYKPLDSHGSWQTSCMLGDAQSHTLIICPEHLPVTAVYMGQLFGTTLWDLNTDLSTLHNNISRVHVP